MKAATGTASERDARVGKAICQPTLGRFDVSMMAVHYAPDPAIDGKFATFYDEARVTPAQLKAAPAKICGAEGQRVAASEVKPPHHPAGFQHEVMTLWVTCKP